MEMREEDMGMRWRKNIDERGGQQMVFECWGIINFRKILFFLR